MGSNSLSLNATHTPSSSSSSLHFQYHIFITIVSEPFLSYLIISPPIYHYQPSKNLFLEILSKNLVLWSLPRLLAMFSSVSHHIYSNLSFKINIIILSSSFISTWFQPLSWHREMFYVYNCLVWSIRCSWAGFLYLYLVCIVSLFSHVWFCMYVYYECKYGVV